MADSDKSLYSLRYNQITSNLEAFGGGSPQWTNITLNNVDPTQVPVTRLINTTSPLTGGGNLTADRTFSIPQATSSVDGFLLAADWATFNSKLTSILTSANIFVGDGANVAVSRPVTGDVTLSNTGVVTLVAVNSNVGSFTNANITVNAKGQITATTSGADTGITQLTGDVTAGPGSGSQVATLATVNASPGTTTISTITTNAKGLVTANSSAATTGSGSVVLATSPTLTTPAIGAATATSLTISSLTPAGIVHNDSSGILSTSLIVNADVHAAAAIAFTKLASTGGFYWYVADLNGVLTPISVGASKAIATDANGSPVAATTTSTELNFVSGVTSAIQTQLNGKQATGNYITALTGDVTATGPGSVAATLATVNASPGTTTISTITTNGKGLVTANSSATTTGSGSVVLATSPTLATPLLGTPTSGNLSNCTSLPIVGGTTGTLTAARGGTGQTALSAFVPTTQQFTSGSGTYTTPAGVTWLRIKVVGGGGGGSGSGTAGAGNGGTGGTSTFGTTLLSATGGTGGAFLGAGGQGGTASLGTGPIGIALSGGQGTGYSFDGAVAGLVDLAGGSGVASPLGGEGGGGSQQTAGYAAIANTGSGGGGGGSGTVTASGSGSGGGAGGWIEALITSSIAASYSYAIGAAGSAGGAGTSGFAGGAGGSGFIIVEEHYI